MTKKIKFINETLIDRKVVKVGEVREVGVTITREDAQLVLSQHQAVELEAETEPKKEK